MHIVEVSLTYALPRHVRADVTTFVCSGTDLGETLLSALRRQGTPPHMVDAGFVSVEDFWPPWCVALQDGVIASIAFAARMTERARVSGSTRSQTSALAVWRRR